MFFIVDMCIITPGKYSPGVIFEGKILDMAYARHQSFYIRDKWFSKGLKAVSDNVRFFFNEYSFETIGLGKNMVESLKYWLLAFNVLEEKSVEGQRIHELSDLGKILYEYDRFLQRKETLAILHYNLVKNKNDQSTVFEWFFNKYKETFVSKPELLNSFITWVRQNETKEISEKSLKRDIDCLIQFYTKKPDEDDPEDTIFSPFYKMALIRNESSGEGFDTIKKVIPEIDDIGIIALYYVLLSHQATTAVELISIDEILNGDHLWGKTYNLSRSKVVEALNILTNHEHFPIEYVRTNNLDYIKVPSISPIEYLRRELLKG